jgi:6-hydroxytryprostatin B O-methyltransferase
LLCHFNVAENVPLEKGISYAELAKKTGLSEDMLTRAVRLVATSYIFVEKEPGIVSHTARSKILAAEPGQKVSNKTISNIYANFC